MGASLGGNRAFVSEINVTPFVDVMLVLLIIFMVTAPMLTEGLDVDLPRTQAVESLPTGNDNVVLTIKKDSSIYINEYPETMDGLAVKLATVVRDAGRSLFLQADREVPYGTVVYVMGKIKAAGIETLSIVAERVDDEPPAVRVTPPADGRDRSR
jgi:biopolymer transport protein TolR